MTMTEAEIEQQVGALAERLFGAGIGAFELLTVDLGRKLGFYAALEPGVTPTAPELAAATGTDARYVREWLEQQAVGGLLEVDDIDAEPDERRYSLPPAHAAVLVDEDSLAYLAPIAGLLVSCGGIMDRVVDAYRTGAGIPFGDYGEDLGDAQAAFNRPAFKHLLAGDWLAEGVPDVDQRLRADPPARVLDVGCGYGWSSVALAEAYPLATVVGVDLDEASIDRARRLAAESGVADRVTFEVRNAADPAPDGPFDAAFVFEAVHDMPRPVEVLAAIRAVLADGAPLVVMDERVGDSFVAPGDEVERFLYAASVLHCLPVGRSEEPSAATGTVMRRGTFHGYGHDAGFATVEDLPIEHDIFRFYRLEN